jgi:large subunit ribosomal protein L34e
MPRPSLRTNSLRKIRKKLPGGASIIHYVKKRPAKAMCAGCGKELHGVASGLTSKVRALSKTEKRPNRAFGGRLCSECSRKEIKNRIR